MVFKFDFYNVRKMTKVIVLIFNLIPTLRTYLLKKFTKDVVCVCVCVCLSMKHVFRIKINLINLEKPWYSFKMIAIVYIRPCIFKESS